MPDPSRGGGGGGRGEEKFPPRLALMRLPFREENREKSIIQGRVDNLERKIRISSEGDKLKENIELSFF